MVKFCWVEYLTRTNHPNYLNIVMKGKLRRVISLLLQPVRMNLLVASRQKLNNSFKPWDHNRLKTLSIARLIFLLVFVANNNSKNFCHLLRKKVKTYKIPFKYAKFSKNTQNQRRHSKKIFLRIWRMKI